MARRAYPTDRADLWDCLTNPERIPRWFLPVTGELAEGGKYQVVGNAGGMVESCDEPRAFAVTWEFGGMVSWLAVSLTEGTDGTTLELVHEAPVDPDMWALYGPGAVGLGWDMALLGLGMHVETGEAVDPEVAAGLNFMPEGQAVPPPGRRRLARRRDRRRRRPRGGDDGGGHGVRRVHHARVVTGVFEALGDATRRHVLEVLSAGEQAAGDVVTALQAYGPITQPGVSQHLRVLPRGRPGDGARGGHPARVRRGRRRPRRGPRLARAAGPARAVRAAAGRPRHRGRPWAARRTSYESVARATQNV